MAYKTISFYTNTKEIIKVLTENLGYRVTNIRDILVREFNYKSAKDIRSKIRITSFVLHTPLVYRDKRGYFMLVSLISTLLESYDRGDFGIGRMIDSSCLHYHYGNINPMAIHNFRAETVYETHLKLLLTQNKLMKYENISYLP